MGGPLHPTTITCGKYKLERYWKIEIETLLCTKEMAKTLCGRGCKYMSDK